MFMKGPSFVNMEELKLALSVVLAMLPSSVSILLTSPLLPN